MSGTVYWDTTDGSVYGFRLLGRAFVKIGCTRNKTALRFKQLQQKAISPLYVLGEVPIVHGLFRVEKRLKHMLASYVHYGEWFAIDLDTPQFYALVHEALSVCRQEKPPTGLWHK